MPTNTDAPSGRIITDFNRDLFGRVFFTVGEDLGGRVLRGPVLLSFSDVADIRSFANELLEEAARFAASGA